MPALAQRAADVAALEEHDVTGRVQTAARLAQIHGLMAILPLLPPSGRDLPFDYLLWPAGPSVLPR